MARRGKPDVVPCRGTGETLEAECDDYATKPVELPLLLGMIQRLTAKSEKHERE
jgi:CheY-like chemotaxis protein